MMSLPVDTYVENASAVIEVPWIKKGKVMTGTTLALKQRLEAWRGAVLSKDAIETKLIIAAQRRNKIIQATQTKAADHMEHVRFVRLEQIERTYNMQLLLAQKISFRTDLANQRKLRRLGKMKENFLIRHELKLKHTMQTKALINNKTTALNEKIKAQMNDALTRRLCKIEFRCSYLREVNQRKIANATMTKKMEREDWKYLDEILHGKYLLAHQRCKEKILSKQIMVKSKNRIIQDKVQALKLCNRKRVVHLASRNEERSQVAAENRESFLQCKILRCTTFRKVDQAKHVREERVDSAKRGVLVNVSNKMEANMLRRAILDQYKLDSRIQFNMKREKVILNRNCMDAIARENLAKTAAHRVLAAERRRLIMQTNRTDMLEGKRMMKVLKGSEVRKCDVQKAHQMYDLSMVKQLLASERKKEKLRAIIMKPLGRNINALDKSGLKSDNSKTRYDIDIALSDAAERRESLLLLRAEQAGFMGSRRTKTNFSPAFIASCELSYSLSTSSDSSTSSANPPQCCISWEHPKEYEYKVKAVDVHTSLWIVGFIQQLFLTVSKKLFFFHK